MDEAQSALMDSKGVPVADVQGYKGVDNKAVVLNDEDSLPEPSAVELTEVKQELPPQPHSSEGGAAAIQVSVPGSGNQEDITDRVITPGDDAESIVAIDSQVENRPMMREEILFHFRMAYLSNNIDWPSQLRLLKDNLREDVEVQVLEKLREMPADIHQKLKLSGYLRGRLDSSSVSSLSSRKDKKKQKIRQRPFKASWGMWNDSISKISAYFGSHVASYFVFLRFLIYLDLLMALLMLGLVTVPQLLADDVSLPEGISGDFGALSTSVMFFGAYSDTKWGHFDRPLSFLLTWVAANLLCFLLIVSSMYLRYSLSKKSETSEEEFPFSTRVFSSWDHTLRKSEGALLRSRAIVTQIKEMVREECSQVSSTFSQSFTLWTVRATVNLMVLGVLAGSGYLIFLVADSLNTLSGISDWFDDLLDKYKLPLLVAALKILVPPLLEHVIRFEHWPPRTEVKLTIARTALFYLASLVVFLLSMYRVSSQCIQAGNPTANVSNGNSSSCCWENRVGEEVLKVVLIDLGQIVLTTLLLDYLRAAIIKCHKWPTIGFREFSVASEVLDVIYGQSLVWVGLFFSPLLAVVGFVKLVLVFYYRYVTARMCNVPPQRIFRASRSGNFFMFVLLVNFFVCLFTMTYAIIELEPSNDCGPFKSQDHVYDILPSRVGDLPTWISDILFYVSTPAIVVPFILFLLLATLYFKAKSSSYAEVIRKLRDQLKFERRYEKREVFARARLAQAKILNPRDKVFLVCGQ